MSAPNGYIIYEGPSLLDGNPIVVIATVSSTNQKTGDMVQVTILRSDVPPLEAKKTGADSAICGDCFFKSNGCYVKVWKAPRAIYKAYKKGRYPKLEESQLPKLAGLKNIRFGAYGDPSAYPAHLSKLLAKKCGHTGYSHQWETVDTFSPELFMASCESLEQAKRAWKKGFRTYRVLKDRSELNIEKEILCPESIEGGAKVRNCDSCLLCSGTKIKGKSVAIVGIGNTASAEARTYRKKLKKEAGLLQIAV
jgi:hypothetical protein